MSHHRCLSASSSGNACLPPVPKTRCFPPSGEKNNLSTAREARGATAREDDGVLAPPALRGCTGERVGKQVRKSPAAIGNAAWMRFLEVFSPEEPGRSSALLLGHPLRQRRSRTDPQSPTGLSAIPRTCQRETHPGLPKREAAQPNLKPRLHLLLFLLHLHPPAMPHLPASRACSPGGFLGVRGKHSQEMQIPKLTLGDSSGSRHSRHRLRAVLGSQPGGAAFQAKRGREKPLLNRKPNWKAGEVGGCSPRGACWALKLAIHLFSRGLKLRVGSE